MTLAIWMTDGWEVSASTSEESQAGGGTAGSGGVIGLVLTSAIMLGCMSAYLRIGTPYGFSKHQDDALTYVAAQLGGGAWRTTIIAAVLISTSTALWTTILYLCRSVYAMGRDGVLPLALGRLDRRQLPNLSLVALSCVIVVFTMLVGLAPGLTTAVQFIFDGTAIYAGLLFSLTGFAAASLFHRERGAALLEGAIAPGAGAVLLLLIIAVEIWQGKSGFRLAFITGLLLGVPFSLWRGRVTSRFCCVEGESVKEADVSS